MFDNIESVYPGIFVYRNIFKKELNIINRLEEVLGNEKYPGKWNEAYTGYATLDKSYRDCFDHKIVKLTDDPTDKTEGILKREAIWQDCYDAQLPAVNHYRSIFGIADLNYWEAMNFIKYGPNQHFNEHSDHGYSYVATVSLVGYLNDDYEGGELTFNKFGITIKPKAGDLYIFPSSYIYSHTAEPVKNGMKYSCVTMLDYHAAPHCPEYFELEKKFKSKYHA